MKKFLLFLLILVFSIQLVFSGTLKVMSFNIQIFGKTKSSNTQVMNTIIDIINDYDLIAIQEIRDSSSQTIDTIRKMLPENYKLVVGPREGRSYSKEQAIFIYNDNLLNFLKDYNFDDPQDIFERSPFVAYFETDDHSFSFQIINIHISPKQAKKEIPYLASFSKNLIIQDSQKTIILGDMNADGDYFKEQDLSLSFPINQFTIVISNEYDTTVSNDDATYDRIIITNDIKFIDKGVLLFDTFLNGLKPLDISDHYPVWIQIEY